ncbi:hypothetical protein SKA34_12930 [Photobacterium sp. SKA34]|nr:hypothetical protein SKA34_12930 [Photobacterium sp. SKA34]
MVRFGSDKGFDTELLGIAITLDHKQLKPQ